MSISVAIVEEARRRIEGRLVIGLVAPDYYALYPKACMGGWDRRSLNVTPVGGVLPCHAAESIPELEFWFVLTTRLRPSGVARPRLTPSAAWPGCPSLAGAATARSAIGADANARRWRSSATQG